MIRVQNSGVRGLYIEAEFIPYDRGVNEVLNLYSGVSTIGGQAIKDAGWIGPTGSSEGPVRAALRYSFQGNTVQDAEGNDVGEGNLTMFTAGEYLKYSEEDDFLPGYPGERYFSLPEIGRCYSLTLTVWTPLNMYDDRTIAKTSGVTRSFAPDWPVEDLTNFSGLIDYTDTPGSSGFFSSLAFTTQHFSRDESAVAAGTAGEFPTHGVEYLPGEITL